MRVVQSFWIDTPACVCKKEYSKNKCPKVRTMLCRSVRRCIYGGGPVTSANYFARCACVGRGKSLFRGSDQGGRRMCLLHWRCASKSQTPAASEKCRSRETFENGRNDDCWRDFEKWLPGIFSATRTSKGSRPVMG